MNHYKIADLTVSIQGAGETLQRLTEPYRTNPNGKADITMIIHRERMNKAREEYPHLRPDEWEYIQTGFAFACKLPDFDGFCLHASAVALENRAVLFSGPCGSGKSTHANLWQQYFGEDRAVIINDDKPVLRLIEDIFYVYGAPWSGKSALNANIRVPLGAVVFLKQAKENHIRRLDNKEAVTLLFYQSMRPNSDRDRINRLLTLIDVLLQKIPVYQMDCNISFDAVKTGYNEIWQSRMETGNEKMKIKSDYVMREVAGTCVVVPTGKASVDFSGLITLNGSGAFLWKQLAEDKSEQELLSALLEEYETDETTAKADISEFLDTLKAADLLA